MATMFDVETHHDSRRDYTIDRGVLGIGFFIHGPSPVDYGIGGSHMLVATTYDEAEELILTEIRRRDRRRREDDTVSL